MVSPFAGRSYAPASFRSLPPHPFEVTTVSSRIALVSVVLSALSPALRSQTLQWEQNPDNARWYGVPLTPTTWTDAENLALSKGGHLATIRGVAENAFLQSALANVTANGFWIGLNDASVEGQYVWTSGVISAYTNWAPGEPNNQGNQDVVRLTASSSWRWEDVTGTEANTLPLVERAQPPAASWSLPRTTVAGNGAAYLAVGNFNGDTRPDYVVPNRAAGTVSVFLGQPDGTLTNVGALAASGDPITAVVADFDGDTKSDVAVSFSVGHRVRVWFGDGAGGFPTSVDLDHAGNGTGLVAGDFDGDGRVDLAETTLADRLLVWTNAPGVGFTTPTVYPTGSFPSFVTAGDLNHDGQVDLIVSNFLSNDLSIFLNQGASGFTSSSLLARGTSPGRVCIADFDGDTDPDLAIPLLTGGIKIFWGHGNGTFDPTGPILPLAGDPGYAIASDFDGDGRADVAVTLNAASLVAVVMGRPGATFAAAEFLRCADGPTGLVAVDHDQDGFVDLTFAAGAAQRVGVLRRIALDCNANGADDLTDIALFTSPDCNSNSVPDECDLALGSVFDCDGNGQVDSCEIQAGPALDLNSNAVLDRCESAGVAFCFGDGSGAACPCDPGQAGEPGTGCRHSQGMGARLEATGNPQVSADSVTFRATDLPFQTVGLLFQGTQAQAAGIGAAFGDGLLCVNQNVLRLRVRLTSTRTIVFGREVLGDPALSSTGLVPIAGGVRFYQLWYRDSAEYCAATAYNLTNGFRITWAP